MDRKAWIVIALCCLGLYLNLNFSRKNAEALREQEREALVQKKAAQGKEGGSPAATDPATGEGAAAGSERSEEEAKVPETDPVLEEKTFKLSSGTLCSPSRISGEGSNAPK